MWPKYGTPAIYLTGTGAWNGVRLYWDTPSPYGYAVRRCTTKFGTYTTIAKLDSSKRSYLDATGEKGQPYYYYVAALNASGGIASKSNKPMLTAPPTIADPACSVSLNVTKITYNGLERKPRAIVTYNGTTLRLGTDYTVSYSNNRDAGTGTVKVVGTGKYRGTVYKKFTIAKAKQTITAADRTYYYTIKLQTVPFKAEGALTLTSADASVASFEGTTLQMKRAGQTEVKVHAAATANYLAASTTIVLTVRPSQPKLYAIASLGDGKASLSWAAHSSPEGTVVQYNSNGDFTRTKRIEYIKGTGVIRKATFSNLTRGRTWYFRYATYVTIGGKRVYSKWSETASVAIPLT